MASTPGSGGEPKWAGAWRRVGGPARARGSSVRALFSWRWVLGARESRGRAGVCAHAGAVSWAPAPCGRADGRWESGGCNTAARCGCGHFWRNSVSWPSGTGAGTGTLAGTSTELGGRDSGFGVRSARGGVPCFTVLAVWTGCRRTTTTVNTSLRGRLCCARLPVSRLRARRPAAAGRRRSLWTAIGGGLTNLDDLNSRILFSFAQAARTGSERAPFPRRRKGGVFFCWRAFWEGGLP